MDLQLKPQGPLGAVWTLPRSPQSRQATTRQAQFGGSKCPVTVRREGSSEKPSLLGPTADSKPLKFCKELWLPADPNAFFCRQDQKTPSSSLSWQTAITQVLLPPRSVSCPSLGHINYRMEPGADQGAEKGLAVSQI